MKATLNDAPSPVTAVATGEVGAAASVEPDVAPLATPLPALLTARIFTEYEVFEARARPVSDLRVIVIGDEVPVVLRTFHVVPPSVEYS